MGTGRWGGRGSELGGMRDAPSPMIAEDGDEDTSKTEKKFGRWGGRASDKCSAGDGDGFESGVVTDPPVSEAQRKAMFAAKSGNSTLGIPQSVGKEFAEADPGGKLPAKAKDGFLVNGLPNGPRESQQELAEAKKQGLSPRFNKTTGKVEYEDRRGRSGLGQQPKAKDAEDPDERLHFESTGAMTPQAKRRRIEQLKEMVARGEISESVLRAKVRKFGLEDI